VPANVTGGSIETVTVTGNDGDDTFQVAPAPAVAPGAPDGPGLFINVDGGQPQASDALVITNLAAAGAAVGATAPLAVANDFVIIGHSRTPDAGNVVTFNNSTGTPVRQPGIGYTNVEVVSPNFGLAALANPDGTNANLLVLGPDNYEQNEDRLNAAYLGTGDAINVENLAIFPNASEHPGVPADVDYFRVVAEKTGTLDFQVYFNSYNPALLPTGGQLEIDVLDVGGNLIAGANTATNTFGGTLGAPAAGALGGPVANIARVRIPAVQGQTYFVRVFGANAAAAPVGQDAAVVNGYDMTITNEAPTVPYGIELDDLPVNAAYNCDAVPASPPNSDTGRSHVDDITCDARPQIIFRLDDAILLQDVQGNDGTTFTNNPPDGQIAIPFNSSINPANGTPGYRVPVFIEGSPQQIGTDPQIPIGFAQPVVGVSGVYTFDFDNANNNAGLTLTDGSHFITAKVQIIDPSDTNAIVAGVQTGQTGYGARSQSSDSGVAGGLGPGAGNETTLDDRITNDETPTFFGRAEADSFVRVFLDTNLNNTVDATDLLLGQTTALPLDGNNQFPGDVNNLRDGVWELTSTINMNDPNVLTALGNNAIDGLRRILVTAEDVAGNIEHVEGDAQQILDIFIDTKGPQVTALQITDDLVYNIWDHKDTPNGTLRPTPLTNGLTVSVRDFPIRLAAAPGTYVALQGNEQGDPVNDPGNYLLVGDYTGVFPIQGVTFTSTDSNGPSFATGTIALTFASPLPDDRYTLTIRDNLVDPAGNKLDGETNAIEPHEPLPNLPSGDGQAGGDFVARFTIDSRPEVGVWASGTAWIDTNGNESFDPNNLDFTNRDIVYSFGNGSGGTNAAFTSDDFFAGNFSLGGPADGFDKLAVYGSVGAGASGPWRFLVDTDNNGVPNVNADQSGSGFSNALLNGLPVAGNFAAGNSGDEVGIFNGTSWLLDTDGDYVLDTQIVSALRGYPIVGDFDGDGSDDFATWTDDQFQFDLANDGFGDLDATISFGFIGVRERPLAADLDQDGIDDVGLWSPDLSGIAPDEHAEWFFLLSDDPIGVKRAAGTVTTLDHPFQPEPFGHDLYMQFGSAYSIPIIGNFDPPATGGVIDLTEEEATDIVNRLDVNQDGHVTPLDALIVINEINANGSHTVFSGVERLWDVNNDGSVAPSDVLMVFNYLADNDFIQAEGEGSAAFSTLTNETSVNSFASDSSDVIQVADGQFVAAADTMRIDLTPIAPASAELEGLFALLDDDDQDRTDTKDDDTSSIDSLLALEPDEFFAFDTGANDPVASALDELLSDEELFAFDELAEDVLSSYDRGEDLA
jgi:hypothetical protein